jgi:hypothetical protein
MDPIAAEWCQPGGTTISEETAAVGDVEAAECDYVLQAGEYAKFTKCTV